MHFVISATYGPTDPTRAMPPFIFAATALQDGDKVTLMLFTDAVVFSRRWRWSRARACRAAQQV